MNPAQLLSHFDRIIDAPNAIPRLRRFILDLAVRGKLVEQDPRDEPASELLKRIEAGRLPLQGQGKSRKQEFLEDIDESEHPFELPASWIWARLGDIGDWGSGSTPPRGNSEYYGGAITWLKSGELGDSLALRDSEEKVTPAALQKCSFRLNRPGDVLIAMYGATIGKLAILAEPAVTNQAVCGCTPFAGILNRYLFTYLLARRENFHAQSEGGAQPNISKVKIVLSPFALPPLAEQHRIVAKVDELMALCDRLEAAQAERESRRDRLVASSLDRLSNGADANAFHDQARFYFNHLPRLTTKPEHIQQLRQTILNLAVRGKLVPQDPSDEPASILLKRIQAEIPKLQATKGICAQKSAEPNKSFEADTEIPSGWIHAYLQELAYQISDGTHLTPKYTEKGKPFLSAQNIKPFRFMPQKHRFVSSTDFAKYRENRKPEREDVLLTRVGAGIGEAAILDSDLEFAFYVSVCLIKIPTCLFKPQYLVIWLNSPEGRNSARTRTYGKGASQGNLNLGLIRTFRIPLPPLAEQQRIVAKVDELMALCDKLEAQLTITQTESHRLLEAVLHEALAPAV